MKTHDNNGNAIQVMGHCCGCGKLVQIYLTSSKHGEKDRYNIPEYVTHKRRKKGCKCGSRTAALINFHVNPKRKAFKRPDRLQRRTRKLLRNLKHIEWENPDAKDYNQIKFKDSYSETLKEASTETQIRSRIFDRLFAL